MVAGGRAGVESRLPLTKERVLSAAFALADERGIESLSMRKLAHELGFEVMSLYNHVASKKEMLNGIVDLVGREIEHPESGSDWKTAMRDSAVSARMALLRHPWACTLWSSSWPGPARKQYAESLLRCFREAGFSVELAHHGFHAVNTHVLGFALQELNVSLTDAEMGEAAESLLREIPPDELPYMAEHVMHHLNVADEHGVFEFVLDLILDGLDREARGGAPSRNGSGPTNRQ